MYDERYYTNNNYTEYLDRAERYAQLISELHYEFLPKVCLDNLRYRPILDFGCAVGFAVKAFKDLGYTDVRGYDISEWAVNYGAKTFSLGDKLSTNKEEALAKKYDLVLALDVLEHMPEDDLYSTISRLKCDYLIVRIPVAKSNGGQYVLSVSEKDSTHVIRWTKLEWIDFFERHRMKPVIPLKLYNIYDTPGVLCGLFRHIDVPVPFA